MSEEKSYGLDNKFNYAMDWIKMWKETEKRKNMDSETHSFKTAIIKSLEAIILYLASNDSRYIINHENQIFNEVIKD